MSVLTSTHPDFGGSYFHNVAKAASALLTALTAIKPRRAGFPADDIESVCRRYEALTPNLADELRFMASRG